MAKSSGTNPMHQAVYSIRIERETLERLHEIAESEHRTLAGKIRVLLEREIADHANDAATPASSSPPIAAKEHEARSG